MYPSSINLLILDVDGVLTDGRIIVSTDGESIKRFDVRDGHCPENDIYQARTYPIEVRDGWIWVGVPADRARLT